LSFNRLTVYQAIVHMCAIAFLSFLWWRYAPVEVPVYDLAFWIIFGLAAHAVQFNAAAFHGQNIRVSVGFAASTAVIALFPPPVAMALISLGSLSWRDITGKTQWHKVAFNRSMFMLCGGIASLVFTAVFANRLLNDVTWTILSNLVAAIVYFVVNSSLVSMVVAFASDRPVAQVWRSASSAITLVSYLTLATFGSALALVYNNVSPLAVLFFGIPLVASYYALQNSARVRQFYTQLIQSLSDSIDLKEPHTGGHTRRIAIYAQHLGRLMGLRGNELESLFLAGLLHDLGKLGMPDRVLLKPGPLTDEEWQEARRHPVDGWRLLSPYEHLDAVARVVRHHHERFDGTGYPDGLKGDEIPIGARIVSVVDAFDAMYLGRPYRGPVSWDDVKEEFIRSSETQFDPKVVEAFLTVDWPKESDRLVAQEYEVAH